MIYIKNVLVKRQMLDYWDLSRPPVNIRNLYPCPSWYLGFHKNGRVQTHAEVLKNMPRCIALAGALWELRDLCLSPVTDSHKHSDALGNGSLSVFPKTQLCTCYFSLGNTMLVKLGTWVLIARIKWAVFCCISLCDVFIPKPLHELHVLFCPHLIAMLLSGSGSCFTAHHCQNNSENPNHRSRIVLENVCVYFLGAIWPLTHTLVSPGIYPVFLCYFVIGPHPYLEEPHSQTVPDGSYI